MEKIIKNKLTKIGYDLGDKLSVIHVWSDDRAITPKKESNFNKFKDEWKLSNKFIITYSGNMGRFHDMETIMEAANKLSNNKNMVFLFIGEGHKKGWMIEYANRHGLANCQFHTYVEREKLGDMLSCADIGLVSLLEGQQGLSVPSKCFGLMAAGIPVIGIMPSNSEMSMVIKEEQCGIVVDPSDIDGLVDAILKLYNNPQLRVEMGLNGRKGIDTKYSLDLAADAYVDLIVKLDINRQTALS
jgi:glycosyltransferase involved in cell wall biosynthesis